MKTRKLAAVLVKTVVTYTKMVAVWLLRKWSEYGYNFEIETREFLMD